MSTSDERISVGENWSTREILAAGWLPTDLAWETGTENIVEAIARDDVEHAKPKAGEMLQLARADFQPNDPRLGTSLANYAICLRLCGDGGTANLLSEAIEVWRRAESWVAHMQAPRTARSSLFHLRMELRHRDTYRVRWQQRWEKITAEARKRLEELDGLSVPPELSTGDLLARWRRERPAMLNDTRKLMAAAYLLLAPPVKD